MCGCDLDKIKALGFDADYLKNATPFLRDAVMERAGDIFRLTKKGKFLADGIAAALFIG